MKKSRFTETQILTILKEADGGIKIQDICRNHSISSATYYQSKSKFGGMEASDIKRLRDLEAELYYQQCVLCACSNVLKNGEVYQNNCGLIMGQS